MGVGTWAVGRRHRRRNMSCRRRVSKRSRSNLLSRNQGRSMLRFEPLASSVLTCQDVTFDHAGPPWVGRCGPFDHSTGMPYPGVPASHGNSSPQVWCISRSRVIGS